MPPTTAPSRAQHTRRSSCDEWTIPARVTRRRAEKVATATSWQETSPPGIDPPLEEEPGQKEAVAVFSLGGAPEVVGVEEWRVLGDGDPAHRRLPGDDPRPNAAAPREQPGPHNLTARPPDVLVQVDQLRGPAARAAGVGQESVAPGRLHLRRAPRRRQQMQRQRARAVGGAGSVLGERDHRPPRAVELERPPAHALRVEPGQHLAGVGCVGRWVRRGGQHGRREAGARRDFRATHFASARRRSCGSFT
eukprot:scaffold17633_cov80-Isochrysis_galbana.AAC.3